MLRYVWTCRADEVIVSSGGSGEDINKRVAEVTGDKGAYAIDAD